MTSASRLAAIALASVSTLALTAAAQAQPVTNWTGFYVGVNAGAAWGRSDATTAIPCNVGFIGPAIFCVPLFPLSAPQVTAAGSGSLDNTGFTGGIQAGYNWQSGNFVYGLEADFGAFDISASRSAGGVLVEFPGPGGAFAIASAIDTDWLFTARARLGWTFSNVLIYATGGLAVTNLQTSHSYSDTSQLAASGAWSQSATRAGWTLGGGAELAVARNWTVKIEYLYLNFGSVTASGVITSPVPPGYVHGISTTVDVTAHVARAGLNFRF